jgi:uncharacterized Zn finger protein
MAWYNGYGFKPYVPVAQRRRQAATKMAALRKKGVDIQPVTIDGRKIAKTFWGQAWCDHLESFSDYENRLPRGRTYVRNGSVCHLAMTKGVVEAKVVGSEIYNLRINIKTLPTKKWNAVRQRCAGQIGSLLELLQGKLSDQVMDVVTDRKNGLFPLPGEINFNCDCPDWAVMCKHVAAVLYGVGARLDEKPELLFQLRGVDHEDLIETDAEAAVSAATRRGKSKRLKADALSDVFGIDLDEAESATSPPNISPEPAPKKKRSAKRKVKLPSAKKAVSKAAVKKSKPAAKKSAKKKATATKAAKKRPAAKQKTRAVKS